MKSSTIKNIYNLCPETIRRLFALPIRYGLIGNKAFLNQYQECREAEAISADELRNIQRSRLLEILRFSYSNVPYYHEVFDQAGFDVLDNRCVDCLADLPLLTKRTVEERFDDLQAPRVKDFYLATTGGSTGAPVRVNLDRSSIYRERAFVYSFWARYGYDFKKSRIATFRGVDFNGRIAKDDPLYAAVLLNPFTLCEETLGEYLDAMDSYGCDFIQGYPSAVSNFCRLLEGSARRPKKRFKAVFFISENVEQDTSEYVSHVLGCGCHAFYGHSERAVFAEGCGVGYTFNPLYGFTEVIAHDEGNIVCTGFLNRRMPLIRYAVDDYAEDNGDGTFSIVGHHEGVELLGVNGERITQTALNFHDGTFDAVPGGYQIVQNRVGFAECRLRPVRELDEYELTAIVHSLASKTGGAIEWSVVQDKQFELTRRGKAKLVVQHLDD